ncbi:hypothetical protein [Thioclava pacifica]|uniref:hypothetical protein n=1 Tax=Thioclava pacifica TaxID=285109 RepID=UPI0012F81DBC|nr:hypothetical protein [Thioclava pacifica]
MKRTLSFILAFASVPSSLEAQDWVVTPDQARCLLKNKQAYLESAADVVVITIGTCPETDIFASAMDGKANMGAAPDIHTGEDRSASGYDDVVVYKASDLKCLTSNMIRMDDEKALLPKTVPCKN